MAFQEAGAGFEVEVSVLTVCLTVLHCAVAYASPAWVRNCSGVGDTFLLCSPRIRGRSLSHAHDF